MMINLGNSWDNLHIHDEDDEEGWRSQSAGFVSVGGKMFAAVEKRGGKMLCEHETVYVSSQIIVVPESFVFAV